MAQIDKAHLKDRQPCCNTRWQGDFRLSWYQKSPHNHRLRKIRVYASLPGSYVRIPGKEHEEGVFEPWLKEQESLSV